MALFQEITRSYDETVNLGYLIGLNLRGGEIFECISDLGGGKTTFVRGLVAGFGSSDPVASPSFTISYVYQRQDGKQFHHFDFYRLNDAGVVGSELAEVMHDTNNVVAVEWGQVVYDVLPQDRIKVNIKNLSETQREVTIEYPEERTYLFQFSKKELELQK